MLCVCTCALFLKLKSGLSGMALKYHSIVEKSLSENFLRPDLPHFIINMTMCSKLDHVEDHVGDHVIPPLISSHKLYT